jgi:uncharacterized protein (UPF0333 family)
MRFLKEKKAQGSLEMLLLIGGIVVIATAIGLYLKSIPPQVQPSIETEAGKATGATQ